MPHKRNPKVAERICGLARVVRAAAVVGLENVPLWHERDISHSSAERVVIPDAFLALDYMLDRFTWIVEGLVVYPKRMLRNLAASHGLVFSHRLLLALVESGLPRGESYRIVQRSAMSAWDEERDFRSLVAADPLVVGRLDADALDKIFDLDATVQHVDAVFDRLHALTQKEPVNV
jgi:adenylosuccinate lyase